MERFHGAPAGPTAAQLIQADVRADRGEGLVVVNDQAGELGGTERVLGALLDRYPDARLLALRFSSTNASGHDPLPWPNRRCLIEAGRRRYHFAAPLYARRIARAPIGAATVVLTLPASGGWSLAAAIPPGARHVAYVAGLSRPFFARTSDYLRNYPPAVRPLLRAAGPALRAHNRRLARRPDRLLTNSSAGAATFERTYGRRATVIHPPVMTDYFTPAPVAPRHHLIVARMVPHKRVEVAINAFRGLDERLLVVGDGPWLTRLRAHAPANVEFTGFVADRRLRELYRASRAVICPSEEEFGLVMAEALACGVPVIAPRAGGALEIVRNGLTGVLLERIDPHSIARAVEALRVRHIDPSACRASVLRFDIRHFLRAIEQVLAEERERAAPSSAVQQPPAGARVSAPVPSPAFVAPRSE